MRAAKPADGSPAAADGSLRLGTLAWPLATTAWGVGGDHALSWYHLLIAGKQPMSAHYSLARSAIEGAVTCRWLLAPAEDPETRRMRGAIAQLEDYRNRRTFEADTGLDKKTPSPPAKLAGVRYSEQLAAMKALGIAPTKPPLTTDLFETHGPGAWLYRVLSAHSHGSQWGLLTAKRGEMVAGAFPDTYAATMTADDSLTQVAAFYTVQALRSALQDIAGYLGAV